MKVRPESLNTAINLNMYTFQFIRKWWKINYRLLSLFPTKASGYHYFGHDTGLVQIHDEAIIFYVEALEYYLETCYMPRDIANN